MRLVAFVFQHGSEPCEIICSRQLTRKPVRSRRETWVKEVESSQRESTCILATAGN
jgi:hypothetical protein